MKKVKLLFTFLAIVFMVSACELSPEEIMPISSHVLNNDTGYAGVNPPPQPPPD